MTCQTQIDDYHAIMEFFQVLDYLREKVVRVKTPEGETFLPQQKVVLNCDKDTVVGKVVSGNRHLEGVKIDEEYSFVRRLTEVEFAAYEAKDADQRDRVLKARDMVEDLNLKMHIFASRLSYDSKVMVFFFTSEGNVDFRELVRRLATEHKKRILLRRVNRSDRARMIGNIGTCGHPMCCGSPAFRSEKATMDAVRDQGIMIKHNARIFGWDGRVKDCMAYERSYYQEQRRYLPHIKQSVKVNDRTGRVVGLDILNQKVRILFDEEIVDIFDVAEVEYANKNTPPPAEVVEDKPLEVDMEGVGI